MLKFGNMNRKVNDKTGANAVTLCGKGKPAEKIIYGVPVTKF